MADEYPPPAPEPQVPERPQRQRGAATTGIVLVVIGAVLLAAQFVPGIRWWAAWPLVIIIAGVVQAVTPGKDGWDIARLFEGLSTIAVGVAFLAWTMGVVGGGFIGRLISLWPVLVVAVGFDLLGKALHSSWIKALGSLAVIAALVFAVGMSAGNFEGRWFSDRSADRAGTSEFSEPVDDTAEAELTMKAGVASVRLGSGSDLIAVQAGDLFAEPEYSVERDGDKAQVRLELGGEDFAVPGSSDADVDARISSEVLWDLVVETGVSEFDADLSDVSVRSFELKPGVASCSVRLGDVPSDVEEAVLNVKSGIASVSIEIPEGVEARIESDSGLTGHSISGDFESMGDARWQTPGYDGADGGVWIIKINSGIGSIDIDTY